MDQKNSFDLLASLPVIFFAICFFVNFLIFLWGGVILLLAKGDPVKIEKGKKTFTRAFTVLFIILLIMAVFFIISYLLQQGEVFKLTTQASEEFPPPYHLGIFSPAPEYIDMAKYHFTGPFKIDLSERLSELAVYAILCKKGDKYDVLGIEEDTRSVFIKQENYSCWAKNCELKDIYIAILWTPSDKYSAPEKAAIKEELIKSENPICKNEE